MIKQEREIKDSKHFQVNRLAFYVQLKTMTVDNLKNTHIGIQKEWM